MSFIWYPTHPSVFVEEIVEYGHISNSSGGLGLRDATYLVNNKLRPNRRVSVFYQSITKFSSLVSNEVLEEISQVIKNMYDACDDNTNGYAYFESIHHGNFDSNFFASDDANFNSNFDSLFFTTDDGDLIVCTNEGQPGGGCATHYSQEVTSHDNSNVSSATGCTLHYTHYMLMQYTGDNDVRNWTITNTGNSSNQRFQNSADLAVVHHQYDGIT